jgi:hypothetical protein
MRLNSRAIMRLEAEGLLRGSQRLCIGVLVLKVVSLVDPQPRVVGKGVQGALENRIGGGEVAIKPEQARIHLPEVGLLPRFWNVGQRGQDLPDKQQRLKHAML